MSGAAGISLLVALAALAISAASLWHAALKPAEVILEYLPEHLRVPGGGMGGVPTLYRMELTFALFNLGARAGLLQSVEMTSVESPGAPNFATGIRGPRHGLTPATPEIRVDGEPVSFPMTVEAGGVRGLGIKLEIEGAFMGEVGTQRLGPTPSREPLAQMLADLRRVEIQITWKYRRRAGFLHAKAGVSSQSAVAVIPSELLRDLGARYWQHAEKPDLAEIARREIER